MRLLIALGILSLALQGCHCPPAVRTYEYVTDYERMTDAYDPLASLVYVPRPSSFKNCRVVMIGGVQVGNARVKSRQRALSYATFFRLVLRKELLKLKRFDFVGLVKDAQELKGQVPPGTLLMEAKITKFDMGSGPLRYFTYFLLFTQCGATDLQIEGRITEADTGQLVAEFVDRRRHCGNTPFGPNPHTFDSDYVMKVTATETAQCLARLIEMGCEWRSVVEAKGKPAKRLTAAAKEAR